MSTRRRQRTYDHLPDVNQAMLRIFLARVQILQPDLTRLRIPRVVDKSRLLRAIDRSRGVRGLARVLRVVRLSPSRLSAWRRAAYACELEDTSSCPHASPQRLTPKEVAAIHGMVTSPRRGRRFRVRSSPATPEPLKHARESPAP